MASVTEELHILSQGYLKLQSRNMELEKQISDLSKVAYNDTEVRVVDNANNIKIDAQTAMAMQRAKQMVEESQKKASEKENESDALLKSVAKLSNENEKLQKINSDLADELASLKTDIVRQDGDKYKEFHKSSSDMMAQIADLKEKLAKAEGNLQSAERENKSLTSRVEELKFDLDKANRELKRKTEDLEILSTENDRLTKKNKELEEDNNELIIKLEKSGNTSDSNKEQGYDAFNFG